MAVQTKTQMATELSTNFGDSGAATAAEFRAFATDILDSYALSLAEADIIPNADSTFDLGSTTVAWAQAFVDDLYVRQGIIITEAADHPIVPAAGQAQIWVANTATQTLQVTFDDGTDAEILTAGSGTSLSQEVTADADLIPYFDASDGNNPKVVTRANLKTQAGLQTQGDVLDDLNTLGAATADGEFLVATGAGAFAYESGATARASMGVTIGSDVQAYSATLDVYAANALTAGEIGQLQNIGTTTISAAQWGYLGAATAAGAALLDDADAAAQRTTLGAAALGANVFTGTQDFNGQQVEGMLNKVVASVTGTLTTTAHSGNVLLTTGNVTVPTTAGFNCVLVAGGAHTVTFNSTTSAAMATGDLMTIVVESGTVIHAVLTAAADKVSFT